MGLGGLGKQMWCRCPHILWRKWKQKRSHGSVVSPVGEAKPPPPGPQGAQPLPLSRMSRVTVALMCFGVGQRFLSGENMSSNASKPKTLEMEHRMRPGQLGGRQVQGPAPGH